MIGCMSCVSVMTCADALLDLIVCVSFSDLYLFKIVIGMRSGLTIVRTNSVFPFLFLSIFSWPGASWVFHRLFVFLNKESDLLSRVSSDSLTLLC